jgi:hypothetical protein
MNKVAGAFVHSRTKIAITAAFIVVTAASGALFVTGLKVSGLNSLLDKLTLSFRPVATNDPLSAVEQANRTVVTQSQPQIAYAPPSYYAIPSREKEEWDRLRQEAQIQEALRQEARKQEAQRNAASIKSEAEGQIALEKKKRAEEDASCRERLISKGMLIPTDDPCFDLDDLIKKLASGKYRFNTPTSAYVEEPFRIVLMLATAEGQDVSGPFVATTGEIVELVAPFAQHIEATLRGGLDFKIDPPDALPRTATSSSPVVWEWTVVPIRPGKKMIFVDVNADLILGKQKEHVLLRTLHAEIQINVGFLHWFVSTFSGLWGIALGLATMIIAILGVVHYLPPIGRKGRHHKRSEEPPPVELVTHQQSHSELSPP